MSEVSNACCDGLLGPYWPCRHKVSYLDSVDGACSHSTLPVALVSKDLDQANDDSIDVAVEALQAEGSEVAASLVACNRLVWAHCNQPLMHLHRPTLSVMMHALVD